jgi:carbon dioxide concentrating mechanism protein CcmO
LPGCIGPSARYTLVPAKALARVLDVSSACPKAKFVSVHATSSAFGILEVTGFTPAMVALDAMEKAADVRVVQAELNDFYGVVVKVQGQLAAVKASVDAGAEAARQMGAKPISTVLAHPSPDALAKALINPPEKSPLLNQSVILEAAVETKGANKMADNTPFALGFIETQGFTAVFEAIDSACKAANVEILAKEKLGGGYITVVVKGDVAAVKAAVDAGKTKVEGLGKLIAAHVIARPSSNVLALLPK